jgi:hypothetical protein
VTETKGNAPGDALPFTLIRAEDLVALRLVFFGFDFVIDEADGPRLVPVDGAKSTTAIVEFPPQAIGENSYRFIDTDPNEHLDPSLLPPASAFSHSARLVFELPATVIPFRPERILDWSTWTLLTPAASGKPSYADDPTARTVMELPYRLFFSPAAGTKWVSTIQRQNSPYYELWRTAPKQAGQPLIALWTPDENAKPAQARSTGDRVAQQDVPAAGICARLNNQCTKKRPHPGAGSTTFRARCLVQDEQELAS